MCFVIIRECVPYCLRAYHATYGSKQTPVKIVEPHIRQMQGKLIRLYLVHHYGTDDNNLESIRPCGLVKQSLAACVGRDFGSKEHLKWLQARDIYESNTSQTPRVFGDDLFDQIIAAGKPEPQLSLPQSQIDHMVPNPKIIAKEMVFNPENKPKGASIFSPRRKSPPRQVVETVAHDNVKEDNNIAGAC